MSDIIINTAILSLLLQLIWLYYRITSSHKILVSNLFVFSVFCSIGVFQLVIHIQPELYSKEQVTALSFKDVITQPYYLTIVIFVLMVMTEFVQDLYVKFSSHHRDKQRYNVTFTRGFYQSYADLVKRHKKQKKYHSGLNARNLLGPNGYRHYRYLSKLSDALRYMMLVTLIFAYIITEFWQFGVIIEFMLAIGYYLINGLNKQHVYPDFKIIVIHTDFTSRQIIREIQDINYIKALFAINKVYCSVGDNQLTLLSAHDHLVIKDGLNLNLRMLATTTQSNHQKIGIRVIDQQPKVYLITHGKTDDNDFGQ